MRKTWALVMAAAMAAASLTACSSSKPAETAAPETEAEAAETEETEAEATGDQQEILVAAAASLQYVQESCRPRSKRAQMQTYSSPQRRSR